MLALSVAIVIGVPLFRGWAFLHAPGWDTFAFTPFRIDALALGAVMGILCSGDGLAPRTARRLAVGLLVAGGLVGVGLIGMGSISRATMVGASLQFTAVDLTLGGCFLFAMAVLIALGARRWIELHIQRSRDRLAPRSIAPSPSVAPLGMSVVAG